MAKQMKQDTPLVPRKRRLAALIAATRCGGEKRDTLSCYARRCTASSSETLRLTRRTPSADPLAICRGICPFRAFWFPSSAGTPP